MPAGARIAVLIPCLDEEATIGGVVDAFREHLPQAAVYVYDNHSSDRSVEVARAHGARVGHEPLRGKGHVVRRMFADIEADIYLLVDGDATYDPACAPQMVDTLQRQGLDMVTARRAAAAHAGAYRPGHRLGNRLLTGLVARIFGSGSSDMLSGYRALSRRFVKSFPAQASGFETETELTVHALEMRMPTAEVASAYTARPAGSSSKLSTWKDAARILTTIINLVRDQRPLGFFATLALGFVLTAFALATPILIEYLETGLVPRFPTAILATGLSIVGALLLACGLILDSVARGRRELKRLAYLAIPAPPPPAGPAAARDEP